MDHPTHRITDILLDLEPGDARAVELLVPVVYDELHALAHRQLRREAGHTLSTTALVHEAYLKLVDQTRVAWQNRAHFLAAAAQAMRRILLDHARAQRRVKRGGGRVRVTLDPENVPVAEAAEELLELEDALARLASRNPRLCDVVVYRFYGGMSEEETAAALAVSERTVRRDWLKAKGWLYNELYGTPS